MRRLSYIYTRPLVGSRYRSPATMLLNMVQKRPKFNRTQYYMRTITKSTALPLLSEQIDLPQQEVCKPAIIDETMDRAPACTHPS